MFRNLVALMEINLRCILQSETKCFENIQKHNKIGFLFFKTYFFNLLALVKSPRKEQAAHGVTPGMKNKYFCG